jgi:HPr kinase/phosphorylase
MSFLTVKDLWEAGEKFGLALNAGHNGLCKQILHASLRHDPSRKTMKAGELLIAHADRLLLSAEYSATRLEIGLQKLCSKQTPCIISPDGIVPEVIVKDISNRLSLPFFSSSYSVDLLESRLLGFLREKIENQMAVCGVLVKWHGKGVLIRGDSGAGKSSSAMELILKGGQLVSDDIVELSKTTKGAIIGKSPEATRNLMDIKGRGIVNLKEAIGYQVLANEGKVDLVINLSEDNPDESGRKAVLRMLGVDIPLVYLSAERRPPEIAERIIETITRRRPDTFQPQTVQR